MTNQVENPLTKYLLERKQKRQEMFEALRVLHEIMKLRTSGKGDYLFIPDVSVIFCALDLVQKIDSLLLGYPVYPSCELGRISEFWLEENCVQTSAEIKEMAEEYNRKGKTFLERVEERESQIEGSKEPQKPVVDLINKTEARVTALIRNVARLEREIEGFRDEIARLEEECRGMNQEDSEED